jgi:phosphohistidine phosphatase
MHLYLVHHGEALGPEVDPRRPLSVGGQENVVRLATEAAARGAKPAAVWHSGKLRAKQTAEAFWRACNALAECVATRDLQPGDPPVWLVDRMRGEARDVLVVGHFPHLPRVAAALLGRPEGTEVAFPLHGVIALTSDDAGETWREEWRLEN